MRLRSLRLLAGARNGAAERDPCAGAGRHPCRRSEPVKALLTFEFDGRSLAAALERAVERFADAVADVHPSMAAAAEDVDIEVNATTPPALLLAVLEECLRRGHEGRLAVGLDATVDDGVVLRGRLSTVALDDPRVTADLPTVLSWHELSLGHDGEVGGWRGRVVAR